jgi:hypothetical protein
MVMVVGGKEANVGALPHDWGMAKKSLDCWGSKSQVHAAAWLA